MCIFTQVKMMWGGGGVNFQADRLFEKNQVGVQVKTGM